MPGTEPPRAPVPPTIPAALARAAERFATQEALVTPAVRWTFAELHARVAVAARGLMASGVESGERIAIWAPNSAEWVVASLAVHSAGAVLVPLNTRFKGAEAAHVLRTAEARRLLTVTDFLGTDYVSLLAGAGAADTVDEVVVLTGPGRPGTVAWDDLLRRASAVDAADAGARAAAVAGDDVCDILFTSGTTGAPKGAMLRHGASTRAFRSWADVVGLRAGDRYLIVNPFFHSFGLKAGILACLLTGATMVPLPVLDVETVAATVAAERITMVAGPPTLFQTLLADDRARGADSLRLAVTGAAVVPVELVERLRAEMGFETVITGYGLTESTGMATMCRHDDDAVTVATTAGRAIPDVEVRMVDDEGHPVPAGTPGEVVIRGYNVMAGYFRDPEATTAAIDGDGWLHTGDIATMDDRGNVAITDRKKDMFIVGGFNAYPAEIEAMMRHHPAVAQVAVVGVADDRMGEVGVAFVVPAPAAAPDPGEIIAWCRERMANYKVPRQVRVVDALPLNASGKVLKFELRRLAASSG